MSNIDIAASAIAGLLSFAIDLVRHLRYFAVVADELHFGRAADRLHMAQPPLSQRIQRLERELGVRLFDRSSRRVALSPAGRDLLGPARDVLAAVDRLTAVASLATGGEAGRLRVGLLPETTPATMAAIVRAVERARPGVGLDLTNATTGEQLRALADRMLDVATVRLPADLGALAVGPVLHQPLGVALPTGSPLARRRRLALADPADPPPALPPRSRRPDRPRPASTTSSWPPAPASATGRCRSTTRVARLRRWPSRWPGRRPRWSTGPRRVPRRA